MADQIRKRDGVCHKDWRERKEAAREAELRHVYAGVAAACGLAAGLWGDTRDNGVHGDRKPDRADARSMAKLLQHGLVRSIFVPPAPIRDLHELTHH